MCLNPITIKNPHRFKVNYASEYGNKVMLPKHLSPRSEYITVGCGKCAECRQKYYNSILQRAIVESFTSHLFFVTLTFNNSSIDKYCNLEINGERYNYANYDLLQDALKRFRKRNYLGREFRYLSVNEYGDQSNRPHFHLILFVARHEGDTEFTCKILERKIFNGLFKEWSVNVGTRKNPIYEPLFTYYRKYNTQKHRWESNYYVKYIEPNDFYSITSENCLQDESYIKSIRYIVGYINKPSRYEKKLNYIIDTYKEDKDLYHFYQRILKSRVQYSKGFGCGFDLEGNKFYLDKVSVRASSDVINYSSLTDNLPNSYEEFCDLYPDMASDLLEFANSYYRKYTSWRECCNNMSEYKKCLHYINLKYRSKEFDEVYRNFTDNVRPTVSYSFAFTHKKHKYSMTKVRTVEPTNSLVYKFLREGVESGLKAGVPFLAFKLCGAKPKYIALCKYYKERVCTVNDMQRLFDRLGVNDYEEYINLFNKSQSIRQSNISSGNELKYYKYDIVESSGVQSSTSSITIYNKL